MKILSGWVQYLKKICFLPIIPNINSCFSSEVREVEMLIQNEKFQKIGDVFEIVK